MIEEPNNDDPIEENFFEKMENAQPNFPVKRLQRSKTNVMLTGVCGGIAEYFNADVANIRLIALLSLLLGGWSAVVYLLIAALLPPEIKPKELSPEEIESIRKENFKILVGGLLILVGFYFALQKIGFSDGGRIFILPNTFVMPVLAVVFGIYLLTSRKEPETASEQNTSSSYFQRSGEQRMLTGVCGGLADYLNSDPGSIRIIFFILTLLTFGLFAVVYIIISIFTTMKPAVSNEI